MNELAQKRTNLVRRKNRVKSMVVGTKERPRLTVRITNKNIIAQIIDDEHQNTLVTVSTIGSKDNKVNMSNRAEFVGAEIGKKAKTAKIKRVVFDRGSRLYHGRIKVLAEAVRKSGLEF